MRRRLRLGFAWDVTGTRGGTETWIASTGREEEALTAAGLYPESFGFYTLDWSLLHITHVSLMAADGLWWSPREQCGRVSISLDGSCMHVTTIAPTPSR